MDVTLATLITMYTIMLRPVKLILPFAHKPKHMQTIDDELAERANGYMQRQVKAEKPFFMWLNFTHMHLWMQTKPESRGQPGPFMSDYADTMIDHDKNVGQVLDMIDTLGRQHHRHLRHRQWAARERLARCRDVAVPRREGHRLGRRIPLADDGRWPGHIKPGEGSNDMM